MTVESDAPEAPVAPKRMSPKRLRQTLYWLALDWIHLNSDMPMPPKGTGRPGSTKDYGHPAEWASVKAAEIVTLLTGWHDYMADQRNETRPPNGITFGTAEYQLRGQPRTAFQARVITDQTEKRRLVAAWKYLEPRCEQLCELVDAEALKELPDLHYGIRRTLGEHTPKYTLPVPCPNNECELLTLVRIQGVGQEFISCDACGYTIKEVLYPFLVRMTLDAYLSSATTDSTVESNA